MTKPAASPLHRVGVKVIPILLSLLSIVACDPENSAVVSGDDRTEFVDAPVIVISVDTLRSDRLPVYGYAGVATPAIDALRRDSVLFTRAYTHVPLTLPAHASVFSGLLPADHAVRDNAGYPFHHDRYAWLPEILREQGYVTGAAVSSMVLGARSGFDRGFDFFEDRIETRVEVGSGGRQRPGTDTLSACRGWLRSSADRPFFLFFHAYEPHWPWAPPEPFASRYADPYDGEVAASDRVVGELIGELRELGVYDDSLIVFLSDHGEGLSDHGEEEHGVLLYRESLQVPLMLKLPGGARAGETLERPAQLVDVLPTILSAVGVPVPVGLPGASLLDPAVRQEDSRVFLAETVYPRVHLGWSELFSVIRDRYHYIESPNPELYDLLADPAERENLVARRPDVAERLAGELEGYGRDLEAPEPLGEEQRRELAALGYLGGYSEAGDELADPKLRIHALQELKAATEAFARGDHDSAAELFEAIVEENPGMFDAWEYLGRSLVHLNRPEEALQACLKGVEVSGGRFLVLASARLFVALNRADDAIRLLRSHADAAPEPARLRSLEAGILVSENRFEEAMVAVRSALEIEPDDADALFQRARACIGLGRFDEAVQDFRRLLVVAPDHFGAMNDLAVLLMRSGDVDEAIALFRRVVELRPGDQAATRNLAQAEAEAKAKRMPR